MMLGPVFRAELLRTARRRRYYVMRFLYGSLLLLLVWGRYATTFQADSAPIWALARFAEETFITFAMVQLLTVLVLIPPLFGGAIADEKQRKTLHYLMASQLSGGEIVIDKVLGRLPHLGVFLGIGLPIVCIMGLFGGIPPEFVTVVTIGTVSTATFAVALTVLVSTLARKVRQAVLIAYVLIPAWLFLPSLIALFGASLYPSVNIWIGPINDWLKDSSPFEILIRTLIRRGGLGGGLDALMVDFGWMVGLQLGGALLLVLLAIWQLRPTFRRQEATPARRTWFGARGDRRARRWLARPACGDDAVAWKERYFAPTDVFTRLALLPAIVVITLPLALVTVAEGWIGFGAGLSVRDEFVWALRVDLGWYIGLWLLAVAGASASSVTIEREEDTWVSLTSTPLTGWEIVRGKVLGAIWNQRGFGAVLVLVWSFGLVTGAFHPLGVLASVALVGLLTCFVAALGFHASLRARSTSRALASTLAALCLFNAYPFVLLMGFFGWLGWESSFSVLGALPRLAVGPLVSYRFVGEVWAVARASGFRHVSSANFVAVGLLLLSVYVGAAAFLTWRIVGRFDRWLDRPRLSGPIQPAPDPTRPRDVPEPALQS